MSKKTKLIVAGFLASLAASAFSSAKPPVITLGGIIDTQVGYRTQKAPFDNALATSIQNVPVRAKLLSYGLVNDTKIHLSIDGKSDWFNYGAFINLNADTSASKENEKSVAHQTMLYLQSRVGRIEVGSYVGAYDAMKVNGASVARATGGIDGDWKYWVDTDVDFLVDSPSSTGLTTLIFAPTLPTARDKSYEANASKISYYTPKFNGFRAGISYIPDTDQHGTVTNLKGLAKKFTAFSFPGGNLPGNLGSANQTNSFYHVIQGGVSYKYRADRKTGFIVSAFGEVGDAKKRIGFEDIIDRYNLKAYELGAKIFYSDFAVAGSYGDWGKTGLSKSSAFAETLKAIANVGSSHYWTAGASYSKPCYGVSVSYLRSSNAGMGATGFRVDSEENNGFNAMYSPNKGKVEVLSFGADYTVAPGLLEYIELTQYRIDSKFNKSADFPGKNRGLVFLTGLKLHF